MPLTHAFHLSRARTTNTCKHTNSPNVQTRLQNDDRTTLNQVGTIESPELVRALFDIYLGPDPVSADAKADFARGLAALLRE